MLAERESAVVSQASGTTQGLLTAKSRVAKQVLTIPRLELIVEHMAVNLAVNVRNSLTCLSNWSTHDSLLIS